VNRIYGIVESYMGTGGLNHAAYDFYYDNPKSKKTEKITPDSDPCCLKHGVNLSGRILSLKIGESYPCPECQKPYRLFYDYQINKGVNVANRR